MVAIAGLVTKRMGMRFQIVAVLAAVLLGGGALAADRRVAKSGQAENADAGQFFESKIRPLLVYNCFGCHGEQKQTGGLRLDSREAALKGAASGAVILPGDPDRSRLIAALNYGGAIKMPPPGKLRDSEIADIKAWIKMGAPWPEAKPVPGARGSGPKFTPAQRNFWSFRPLTRPTLPTVKNPTWCSNPIDRFILAKLEQKGLSPSLRADKRTLFRRAAFDLTGLPPTAQEIDAFLADKSTDAFAKVVDRLLASPRYGERWARHWLDLVRYCDSLDSRGSGQEGDIVDAWKYRDWVVDSLNSDMPYSDFITNQVAGDLLPSSKIENRKSKIEDPPYLRGTRHVNAAGIIATCFLAVGNWGNGDADKDKILTDIADDNVDVVSRAFLGLTVACARCHDHKFDPITQRDYYALAGIFFSTHILPKLTPKGAGETLMRIPLESKDDLAEREQHKAKLAEAEKRLLATRDREYSVYARTMLPATSKYMVAAWDYQNRPAEQSGLSLTGFAAQHNLQPFALRQWTDFVSGGQYKPMSTPIRDFLGNSGIHSWKGAADTPSATINTNDIAKAIISFTLPPRSVAVHPGPTTGIAVIWTSPVAGTFKLTGKVSDADPNGGDGIAWIIDHRRVAGARELASGDIPNGGAQEFGKGVGAEKLASIEVKPGESLQLLVLPKQNHTCDTTIVDFILSETRTGRVWDLSKDMQRDPLDGNPHKDGFGNPGVWRFQDMAGSNRGQRHASGQDEAWAAWDRALGDNPAAADHKAIEAAAQEFQRGFSLADNRSPFWINNPADEAILPAESRDLIAKVTAEIDTLKKFAQPPIQYANGAQDGGVPESPHAGVHDVRVHIRGNYARLADLVPRGFPVILAGTSQSPITKGSGRLDLAQWLTSEKNQLTARVMVNRVWQHHFGEGIVRTPSNFGWLGDRPSHPELLDWLATEFGAPRGAWSLKRLHRMIMLSSTYQQSSIPPAATAKIDPDNRLFGHMNRRRLEAEAFRDSLLAASGRLDTTLGGPAVRDFNSPRRTLYLMTVRSDRTGFGSLFDMADSTSQVDRRTVSVVAPQALFVLNDPFVVSQTRALAERILNDPGLKDAARIRQLYVLLYGRPATGVEVGIGQDYLERARKSHLALGDAVDHNRTISGPALASAQSGPAALRKEETRTADPNRLAWEAYCQILLCANEFMFVD